MKNKSYNKVIDKSVMEVKMYLLTISSGYLQQDIHDIINKSIDNNELRRNIIKRKDIELDIFIKIKRLLDNSTNLDEIERHLVFINILLDNNFKPLMTYKYNFFNYIITNLNFNLDIYCILRHLLKFKPKQLPNFIQYMGDRLEIKDAYYHLLASEILLLEKEYKQVYKHLELIEYDDSLERFKIGLYNYSPRKFKRIIKHQQINHLEPLFNS